MYARFVADLVSVNGNGPKRPPCWTPSGRPSIHDLGVMIIGRPSRIDAIYFGGRDRSKPAEFIKF
jgi:hypothetical protein